MRKSVWRRCARRTWPVGPCRDDALAASTSANRECRHAAARTSWRRRANVSTALPVHVPSFQACAPMRSGRSIGNAESVAVRGADAKPDCSSRTFEREPNLRRALLEQIRHAPLQRGLEQRRAEHEQEKLHRLPRAVAIAAAERHAHQRALGHADQRIDQRGAADGHVRFARGAADVAANLGPRVQHALEAFDELLHRVGVGAAHRGRRDVVDRLLEARRRCTSRPHRAAHASCRNGARSARARRAPSRR